MRACQQGPKRMDETIEIESTGCASNMTPEDFPTELPAQVLNLLTDIKPELVDPHGVKNSPGVFPGMNGIPFRGHIPDLKSTDSAQPQMGQQVHVDLITLSTREALQQYERISQLIANGTGQISFEERQYDPAVKTWRVLIRWCEFYMHMPNGERKE